MKRGIYLVANLKSQSLCENLVFSIRSSGCKLPIRIIHFGGNKINSAYLATQAELLQFENFPEDAKNFITQLATVLTDCPIGFLYRFLAWFSDWEEFIYSDNDIVALTNWEIMFNHLPGFDLVHADEEYITGGKYNYLQPLQVQHDFGVTALETVFTAGHLVIRRKESMISDMMLAIDWFRNNPSVAQRHDQAFLHISSLLGNWKMLNLCTPPHTWLSSWAGDYKNVLEIIQQLQSKQTQISHIHYSGGLPSATHPLSDLLFAFGGTSKKLNGVIADTCWERTGLGLLTHKISRIKKRFKKATHSFISN